jgi:hypothetical protein
MAARINVKGPQGNVFYILGVAKDFLRQLNRAGITDGSDVKTLNDVLKNFRQMDYDSILNALESTSLFVFTGRGKR